MSNETSGIVLVVGAGTMGGGIAQVAAAAGEKVYLYDTAADAPRRALDRMAVSLRRAAEKGHVASDAVEATLKNIAPQTSLECACACSTVIEAVKEDPKIKQEVFRQIEHLVSDSALLCTNTSMLSITGLAAGLRIPARFCGTHFFNPVPRMKLVEVIAGEKTSPATTEAARAMVARWGKTPVMAPDSPGFIVNRVFDAIKREALQLHEEGVDVGQIDEALRLGLNFPMGPFELMDLIGLDTTYDCLVNQARQMKRPADFGTVLPKLVAAGQTGRKVGKGFFDHAEPRP